MASLRLTARRGTCLLPTSITCRPRGPSSSSSSSVYPCALYAAARAIGSRQNAPKGFREAAGRAPMTYEFGEECNHLAKVAHQTKNYGDAISLYDRTLSMRREKYGPIHVECAATLHNIGRVFLDMKEYGAAENALTEAAAIYEQVEGPTSLRYAESLELLGLAYTSLNFLDEAEKAFKDSIRIFRDQCYNHGAHSWIPDASTPPAEEPQKTPLASAAHALADCAALFILRKQESQAIAFLEEALEIRRHLYSRHQKFKPMIAQTLNKLCELKKSMDDSVGAEMCINECLKLCVETFGRDHPATAQATSSKAGLFAARKQFREALRLYEESSTSFAVALGNEAPLFGQELIKLGRIQELCDDLIAAEKSYDRGIVILNKTFGPNSVQMAEANMFLGSLLVKKLEVERAIGLFRDAVRVRKAIDPNDPQLAYLYQKLGDAYAMRRESHAEAYFLLAVEAFKQNAQREPIHRTFMTDVLDDLGLFYLDFQHYDKAERCFKESLDLRIEMLGSNHATVAYSYSNFALLHLQRQELEACERMCQSALDMYAKTARSNVLAQADVFTTLGQAMFASSRHADALTWHHKALNIRRTRGEATETAVAESLNLIARVHVALKEFGQAHRHVKEARRIAFHYHPDVTATLRSEVIKTEGMLPPMEEWSNAERATAGLALEPPPLPTLEDGGATSAAKDEDGTRSAS